MTAHEIAAYPAEQLCASMVYAGRELAELHRWNPTYRDTCSDQADLIAESAERGNLPAALRQSRKFAELLASLTPTNDRWPAAVARAAELLATPSTR